MFYVNIDCTSLIQLVDQLEPAIEAAVKKAGKDLAAMTYAHAVEEANKRLNTRRQMFIDGLSFFESEGVWVVNLDAKVRWIDSGLSEHNMLQDLLKSKKAKRAADGSTYLVVPFQHNKGPTQMTPAQANLLDTIKRELKNRSIPYGKVERNSDGTPKLGKLHSFDITKAPIKTSHGPGQGKGPIGEVKQGPTGIPLLKGVSIYQKKVKDKKGVESVKRSIMTFRVASSKQTGTGRWDHPGLKPVNIMDDAAKWAVEQWEKKIGPQVLAQIIASI